MHKLAEKPKNSIYKCEVSEKRMHEVYFSKGSSFHVIRYNCDLLPVAQET